MARRKFLINLIVIYGIISVINSANGECFKIENCYGSTMVVLKFETEVSSSVKHRLDMTKKPAKCFTMFSNFCS